MIGPIDTSFRPTPSVILAEKYDYLKILVDLLPNHRVDPSTGLHLGLFDGVSIGFMESKFSPKVAICVEQLAELYQSKTVIRVGTCGSLRNDWDVGQCILHTDAVREEGTSRCYLPLEFPASADFFLLKSIYERNPDFFVTGTTWTTDGRYAESDEKLDFYYKNGISSVEMETSALYCVARLRNIRALSLSVVSDHPRADDGPMKGKINADLYNEKVLPSLRKTMEIVLQALAQQY